MPTSAKTSGGVSPVRQGIRDTLPLLPALMIFGLVYGALAVQAGLSPFLTILSSLVIVSGSAQLTMVGLLPFGAGPVLIASAGLALRHIPMSIHLSELMGPLPLRRRLHLSWILVDESYGLTVAAAERGVTDLATFKTASDLMLYTSWVTTTAIGAFFGAQLDPARYSFDVVIPLVYLGLAVAMIKGWRRWLGAVLALFTTAAAITWLPPAWQLSTAAVAAALIASLIPEPK